MNKSFLQSLLVSFGLTLLFGFGTAAFAQNGRVSGAVKDAAGAAIADATIDLINLTSNAIRTTRADASGKYEFSGLPEGSYRLTVKAPGYNDFGRTILVESAPLTEDVEMTVGNIKDVVTVTAARGLQADQDIPLNVTVETSQSIEEKLPVSPGEAIRDTPSLFIFNSSSHLSSPNLRGLQASRVQLVVDGERANNSRTEIQTFGANLGSFIDTFNIDTVEVVAGSGSSLYGTDSLVGTVNFTTKEPPRPDKGWLFGAKTQGLYSSNETGRKGNVTLNISNPWIAFNLSGSMFRFDNYHFGEPNGGTVSLAAVKRQQDELKYLSNSNTNRQDFEISDAWSQQPFLLALGAPENGDKTTVYNSLSHGANGFFNLWIRPAANQSIRYKQTNIHLGYYGFPNHNVPNHHDHQFASFDKNDRYGVRYNGTEFGNIVKRIAGGYYYQKLIRPIDNITFLTPATPTTLASLPGVSIAVRPPCLRGLIETAANCDPAVQSRLQVTTNPTSIVFNKQAVITHGADAQVSLQLHPRNSLIAGYQFWRDTSRDELTSAFYTNNTALPRLDIPKYSPYGGAGFFLNRNSLFSGKGTADSYNQESAFFLQNETDLTRYLKISASYRFSRFTSKVLPAAGFPLPGADAAIAGPAPAGIDLGGATPLAPVVAGTGEVAFTRNVSTGSLAIIGRPRPEISVFGRVGNSLRLPALIETFFFRVFNQGNFAFIFFPNANIRPERGVNVDAGIKANYKYFRGGFTYYNNTYTNFIEQTAPILQAGGAGTVTDRINQRLGTAFGFSFWVQRRNTGRARTQGAEAEAEVPFNLGRAGSLSVSTAMSWQHGEDLTPLPNAFPALERQNRYNQFVGKTIFEFGERSVNAANQPVFSDVPFERIVPFMSSTTIRWQEQKGRFWAELNGRHRTRITRLDPDLMENFLRFGYFTYRSLAGVGIYAARGGYTWAGENGRYSLNLTVDNLSNKFYTEPFQFAAARGRSVSIGFVIESFNLAKTFGR